MELKFSGKYNPEKLAVMFFVRVADISVLAILLPAKLKIGPSNKKSIFLVGCVKIAGIDIALDGGQTGGRWQLERTAVDGGHRPGTGGKRSMGTAGAERTASGPVQARRPPPNAPRAKNRPAKP